MWHVCGRVQRRRNILWQWQAARTIGQDRITTVSRGDRDLSILFVQELGAFRPRDTRALFRSVRIIHPISFHLNCIHLILSDIPVIMLVVVKAALISECFFWQPATVLLSVLMFYVTSKINFSPSFSPLCVCVCVCVAVSAP